MPWECYTKCVLWLKLSAVTCGSAVQAAEPRGDIFYKKDIVTPPSPMHAYVIKRTMVVYPPTRRKYSGDVLYLAQDFYWLTTNTCNLPENPNACNLGLCGPSAYQISTKQSRITLCAPTGNTAVCSTIV